MATQSLIPFFMWCSILNGALLGFWTIVWLLMPDFIYKTQAKWFTLSREKFDLVFYVFLGVFKILFLIFNLVPYIALLLIS